MSFANRALPESQLEVDTLILDYLLYMATRSLLQEQVILREEGVREDISQQPMRMVDSYIPMFKCNHPTDRVPDSIQFRLRLLKFTSLYSKRNEACEVAPSAERLKELRRKQRNRAEEFYHDLSDSSSESSFQEHIFEQHNSARSSTSDDEVVSLADLVPLFIGLSATRLKLISGAEVGVHEGWMELAGEFMLQAALEQCLEYSDCSGTKLREIFSWGWRSEPTKFWEDEESVNDMFCDDEALQEIRGWAAIRQKYIELLKPKSNADLAKQLKVLTRRFPIDRFEERILHFLEAMQASQDAPLLAQLETGKVKGMTKRQVEELRRRIRLPC